MRLSILICTLPEPWSYEKLTRLNGILDPQIRGREHLVEKKINERSRDLPTGAKRNLLVNDSIGEYFCFIDCDDIVSDEYVDLMLDAIRHQPDVVTFRGWMTTDGDRRENFIIKLGSDYNTRGGVHFRFPNHLTAMKRSLVSEVKFKPIWHQEDYIWAKEIHDRMLLKTEVHIDEDLYIYDYITPRKRR